MDRPRSTTLPVSIALVLATAASAALAQENQGPPASGPAPRQGVELSVSSEAFDLGYRRQLSVDDALRLGLLIDDDEAWSVHGRWLHDIVEPSDEVPVRLGIGLSAYAISFDRPDAEAYALAAAGSAEVPFDTELPTRVVLDAAYAPDATTGDEGEGVTDVNLRFECDLSPRATVFLGYRELEVDFERGGDADLDGHLGVGVRFDV